MSLLVPPAAVFAPRAGQAFVYVADADGKRVKLRRVTISEASDTAIRVTGGLQSGEWVATSRLDRLSDGMVITPLRATK
jgi:multidrug efflux pump subunit AcrA (membrane-fusion protein)